MKMKQTDKEHNTENSIAFQMKKILSRFPLTLMTKMSPYRGNQDQLNEVREREMPGF